MPGWRTVELDEGLRRVRVPAGTVLDLGASAKAYAADTIATLLADRLEGGFLVNLGGDLAVSGELPHDGWQVGVEGTAGEVRQVVASHGQAFATSSTGRRTWTQHGEPRHHIVDPRTGHTALGRVGAGHLRRAERPRGERRLHRGRRPRSRRTGMAAGTRHTGPPRPGRRGTGRHHPRLAAAGRARTGRGMNELLWFVSRATGLVSIACSPRCSSAGP